MLFALSNPFQNGMTCPGSIKNHGGDRFLAKRPGCRPGPTLLGLGRCTTHPKVTGHQLSNPWKFHSNHQNPSKVNQHFLKQGITNIPTHGYPKGGLKSKNKKYASLKWDWAVVLPTQKLLQTNLASPENFIQIHSPIQKLFMISFRTDRHTNRQTPYKMKHPSTLDGCRWKFFLPCFFYLSLCSDKRF